MVLVLSVFIVDCSGPASSPVSPGNAPARVIWIAVDSLRADRLGCGGYEKDTSPWIDTLAAKSIKFDWAISPSNHTVRSVAGYFSGKPYTVIRKDPEIAGIPGEVLTLAEVLHAAGLRTSAYTANVNINTQNGFSQGFDNYRVIATPGKSASSIAEIVADVKATYHPGGGKEFIYVHTMDVHWPYRPPQPWGGLFAPEFTGTNVKEGQLTEDDGVSTAISTLPYWSERHSVTEGDLHLLKGLYDGAVRYTDEMLPQLLEALKWDPSHDLLILTADHGEHLYELGWGSHFATITPMETHVPLIVNYERFSARPVGETVSLTDLYPTILDLFGIPKPDGLFGTSLAETLWGGPVQPHDVYIETAPQNAQSAALISGDYWYWMCANRTQIKPWHPWPYEEFLFRYRSDPLCRNNLIAAEPVQAGDLNARLRAYNPRWSAYTRDRLHGSDEDVRFGENLLTLKPPSETAPALVMENGEWIVNAPEAAIIYTASGLTPREPVTLNMDYDLGAGRIHLVAPRVEYLVPGTAGPRDAWDYVCAKPGKGKTFGATILPIGGEFEVRISFAPGTRARVSPPTLRKILTPRIEPWPALPSRRDVEGALSEEEREHLRSLGYL
jgi:arylsulfatase A-like enzyme